MDSPPPIRRSVTRLTIVVFVVWAAALLLNHFRPISEREAVRTAIKFIERHDWRFRAGDYRFEATWVEQQRRWVVSYGRKDGRDGGLLHTVLLSRSGAPIPD